MGEKTIGEAITEALTEAEMTQTELAARLGVHPATVDRWIKGETTPTRAKLLMVASQTGTSFSTFPERTP